MRKIWKRVTAAALSLTFVLSLSACGGGLSAEYLCKLGYIPHK